MHLLIKTLVYAGIVFLIACTAGTKENNNSRKTAIKAHHTKDGYRNLYITDPEKGFFDFLRMRFLGDDEWADHFSLANTVPFQFTNAESLQQESVEQITWLGHSTFLIQRQGWNILTDPIFSDRASPTSFAGPKRYIDHPLDYNLLPAIDWVIISHNHYDHLDTDSLLILREKSSQQVQNQKRAIQFAVPLGLKDLLLDTGFLSENIHELDWWESAKLDDLRIEALPSQHWSSRGLTDQRKTLWASWAIHTDDHKIWFAGDTGYNTSQFKQIGKHLGSVDVALIPIGAYEPRWFMQNYHVNPEEAIYIHQDIGSKLSIGMHWGTFPLTAEAPLAPYTELQKQKALLSVPEEQFITLEIGQTLPLR